MDMGCFFSNQTMNCQIIVFLFKKIHSSLLICNQLCLGCSGEWFSYHKIRESGGGGGVGGGGEWEEVDFDIFTTTTKRINAVLKIVIEFMFT